MPIKGNPFLQKHQTELKPCPFCGERAVLCMTPWDFENKKPSADAKYVIECTECLAQTDTYETAEEAENAWNRRANNG